MIRQIYIGIKNIFAWLPIIWRDRQYDQSFMFRILAHKLELMEKFFNSNESCIADAQKCAKEIKTCRILCKRLYEQNYDSMLDLVHHQENFNDYIKALNDGKPTTTCNTINWTEERWINYEDYMTRQDMEYLCKMLRKHVRGWWD